MCIKGSPGEKGVTNILSALKPLPPGGFQKEGFK